jgi:hypothetical protein
MRGIVFAAVFLGGVLNARAQESGTELLSRVNHERTALLVKTVKTREEVLPMCAKTQKDATMRQLCEKAVGILQQRYYALFAEDDFLLDAVRFVQTDATLRDKLLNQLVMKDEYAKELAETDRQAALITQIFGVGIK